MEDDEKISAAYREAFLEDLSSLEELRDRIVSKQDIQNYISHKIGSSVDSVQIKDGVAISPERKKGFIRIMKIEIKLKQNVRDFADLSAYAHYLEKDMAERSVYNSTYKIVFL